MVHIHGLMFERSIILNSINMDGPDEHALTSYAVL